MAFHPTLTKSGRFFFAPLIKLCEFMGNHTPELLLKIRYRYVFKKPLNLKNPQNNNLQDSNNLDIVHFPRNTLVFVQVDIEQHCRP